MGEQELTSYISSARTFLLPQLEKGGTGALIAILGPTKAEQLPRGYTAQARLWYQYESVSEKVFPDKINFIQELITQSYTSPVEKLGKVKCKNCFGTPPVESHWIRIPKRSRTTNGKLKVMSFGLGQTHFLHSRVPPEAES